MKFTILTQYYPPETGAPQNRLHSLARHLQRAGHDVNVITAMPNYPKMRVFDGYRTRWFHRETIDGIEVRRSWIFVGRSAGFVPRLVNYFSFVFTSPFAGWCGGRRDYLICESPPLFLGISAVLLSVRMRAKLVFNVSDLWPESAEKLGMVRNRLLLGLAYRLEDWLYHRSFLVTGQTAGIVADIRRRFPKIPAHWLPNGVDVEVYRDIVPRTEWRKALKLEGKKVFMYAGNIGLAQGLEVIVKAAALLRHRDELGFVIMGEGPCTAELQSLNQRLDARVVFLPAVAKDRALEMVADAYGYIVTLRNIPLFLGAIPSKIFDALACGVPILLGVNGEAKELFIDRGNGGVHFDPENEQALVEAILKLADQPALRDRLGADGRAYVRQHFDRENIAAAFLGRLTQ